MRCYLWGKLGPPSTFLTLAMNLQLFQSKNLKKRKNSQPIKEVKRGLGMKEAGRVVWIIRGGANAGNRHHGSAGGRCRVGSDRNRRRGGRPRLKQRRCSVGGTVPAVVTAAATVVGGSDSR